MIIAFMLICFQIKHFICDYPLQNQYMLKKMNDSDWVKPLAAHAGVHSLFTFLIIFAFGGIGLAFLMAILDFVIHFVIDRIKAKTSKGVSPSESKFWRYLGLDQMAHHLTHYTIILITGIHYAII